MLAFIACKGSLLATGGRNMYKIGDYTMHGDQGVCKVVEIGTLDLGPTNKDKLYYTLTPIYSKGSMVYSPVDSNKVNMRDIMSVNEANELINNISTIPIIEAVNDKVLEATIKETLKNFKAIDWIRIIKTLQKRNEERISSGKRLSTMGEKYLNLSKELLFGELSIVLDCSKERAEEMIMSKLGQA